MNGKRVPACESAQKFIGQHRLHSFISLAIVPDNSGMLNMEATDVKGSVHYISYMKKTAATDDEAAAAARVSAADAPVSEGAGAVANGSVLKRLRGCDSEDCTCRPGFKATCRKDRRDA